MNFLYKTYLLFIFIFSVFTCYSQDKQRIRVDKSLNSHWFTIANDSDQHLYDDFIEKKYNVSNWKVVDVPHNWDDYGGYRRLLNGNRYGYAWYRKEFSVQKIKKNQHYFLWFEGVGSYATVWVNGKKVGTHAGGRTSFTIDITEAIHPGEDNLLCVRADHPTHIRDLPWVSGGDSKEIGFSEGSQPMGIFRPVHLLITNKTRIIPFGVHIWNDTTISEKKAKLYLETKIKNYNKQSESEEITVVNRLQDHLGNIVSKVKSKVNLKAGEVFSIKQEFPTVLNPHLWSLDDPYLYTVDTRIYKDGKCIDETVTPYGIRWISWPKNRSGDNKQFLLNGKPVYINGIAGYEHLLGQSHAFSKKQVKTRVKQVETAGFNAFRDAHQPHNLRFQKYWAQDGILWWPQFAAHIWFDNPKFRQNFKKLLHDWVIERRNNPAIILWGLENESTLPTDFAEECTEIIRKLDPTASVQRLVTTCNGGTGTDWDVPQNWSGTYGGDPYNYANEVQEEKLIGEYGAWRSIDLHSEKNFEEDNSNSENKMAQLMELKVRLADSVKDKFCGQFMWLLHSHDNPGRVQSGEGYRALDRVGPVNYKGLFTIWGEPVDAFYMYRSNYVSNKKHPMVYIVSHTWPDRWETPGVKNNINVYSNCDKVALYNDILSEPLGVKTRSGVGTHFHWDSVNIKYNVLYAVGYVDGKAVTTDYIILNHLPEAPHFSKLIDIANITKPDSNLNYLYRVDCGGPDYIDQNGSLWLADRPYSEEEDTWGSVSWTNHYKGLAPFFASQRRTFDPIKGTSDWKLFQTYRYGRHDLKYIFPVPDGDYIVELYFTEPWFGIGGGINCEGWRLFDVAVNNETKIHNLDIWKEVGTNHALKKTIKVHVTGGKMV
ncbi:MAG TPA: malectin domain-containing carbohydrate-binding protein, partial [Chitinophagaceae bacterium]|nr:malectin domain-containing carbohydrate-binding protein [Chitinophagaceae bacterium]